MKQELANKQQSQQGASIIMALFLFLVCSVLAAVILAAATTAAGRVAGLAEADQKYYSVMSAAELYRDMFDGKSVSIERTCETEYARAAEGLAEGAAPDASAGEGASSYSCKISSSSGSEPDIGSIGDSSPLLERAAQWLVLSASSATGADSAERAWNWEFGSSDATVSPLQRKVKFSFDGDKLSPEQKSMLNEVVITETVYPSGQLIVSFASGEENTMPYVAELVCEPSATSTAQMSVVHDKNSGKITSTETKTTTITWQVTELRETSSASAAGGA